MTLEQPDEITVLGQHNGIRRSRRVEDVLIRGVTKLEVSDCDRVDAESTTQPIRQERRELRVEPDSHAATIG